VDFALGLILDPKSPHSLTSISLFTHTLLFPHLISSAKSNNYYYMPMYESSASNGKILLLLIKHALSFTPSFYMPCLVYHGKYQEGQNQVLFSITP